MTQFSDPLQFIDVCGVGNTGKSAIVDLLREVDGIWVPEYWFEFDLLRVPGGLLDFRHALVEDWSPIRSHDAYVRFLDVVRKMGVDPGIFEIVGVLDSTGQRYDGRFRRKFTPLALEFAHGQRIGAIRSEWPYAALRDGRFERLVRKLMRRAGLRRYVTRDVHLVSGDGFDTRAATFLDRLYRSMVPDSSSAVALNNGFEPYHPQPALEMLPTARQVIVTRDPRDVYVSGLNAHNVRGDDRSLIAFDNDGMNKSFLATDDLDMFVKRFRLYHSHLSRDHPRILRVPFEAITRNYDETIARVFDFLSIDRSRHARPKQHLDPDLSAKNVGSWKRYSRSDEIRFIERELGDWLHHD